MQSEPQAARHWMVRLSITTEEMNMAKKLLPPIPPGEILFEDFMKPLGLSINALARDIHVPPNRISEIVNGRRGITADTALRLAKYFGTNPEVWLGLQADYDLRVALRDVWPGIEPNIRTRRDSATQS
jgi:addiction module HigA family antidote